MRVGIAIEKSRVSAVAVSRRRVVWAAEAAYSGAEDLSSVLAALATERPRRASIAHIVLGDGVARTKHVAGLPSLKRADLAAHVQLHSKRYFLQNGIPFVTDALPARRKRGQAAVPVCLAAAPLPIVEAIAAGLAASGLKCGGMQPVMHGPVGQSHESLQALGERAGSFELAFGAATAPAGQLSLLPPALRGRDVRGLRRSTWRWAAAATVALLCYIILSIGLTQRQARAAAAELATLAPAINVALEVRRDLDATSEAIVLVSSAGDRQRHRMRFLADLTRALPDSAFLVTLRLDADGGSVSGYARRAAEVMARLERARLAGRLSMEGPVTREVVGGREWERFAIRIQEFR